MEDVRPMALNKALYADFQDLVALRADARKDSPGALAKVAAQFEALFTQMLLKSMRAASLGDGMFDSQQSDFYRDLFDQQVATEMSNGKGLGIAEILVRQLGGAERLGTPATLAPERPQVERLDRRSDDWAPAGPVEFVKGLWPHAKRVAAKLGLEPAVLLAQAALETGWGQRMIRRSDGSSSFNLFGIKAGSKWTGDKVAVSTLEFEGGVASKQRAHFRAYESTAASFEDYAKLLRENSRYHQALGTGSDPGKFLGALQEAGYATDPDYAKKIGAILRGETLGGALSKLKIGLDLPLQSIGWE